MWKIGFGSGFFNSILVVSKAVRMVILWSPITLGEQSLNLWLNFVVVVVVIEVWFLLDWLLCRGIFVGFGQWYIQNEAVVSIRIHFWWFSNRNLYIAGNICDSLIIFFILSYHVNFIFVFVFYELFIDVGVEI